jgi:phage minor structural protein
MIYLFNNKEELIHIIKEQDLIEFTHKIEINTFDAAEFELPIEAIDKEIIEQMRFFGFFVRGRQFGVFKAYEVTTTDNYVVKGLDRAESDLRTVRIIKDKRLQSVTADQALNVALEGTGYQLGVKEGLTKVNKTNFYYISPREALVKIIEAFNCEFRVRYEFVENKIINRYIDLYHRQGSYSGVQFEYGNNALEVTMEEDSDNVVTALIGRGKGEESTDSEGNATGGYGRRIEFADIVWTKASGNPIDKPAGQNYIVLNDDIENKGLYQNGELKHRWGVFVDEEIEDKEFLLQATYQELLRLNNPIRKYKARILDLRDDIWLGDRVAFVKDSAKLSFEARIFSIMIDKLNFDQSEVELGDYETLKSQSQSSSLNAIKEAVRELSEEQETYNRKVQEMIDNKNAEIAEKMRVMRLDMDNGIEGAKNKAEKVKQEIAGTIDQKISGFKQSTDQAIAEANVRSAEALARARAGADLVREAKEIANENVRELNAFRANVQTEREKLSDELKRYSREETTNQIVAIRERLSSDYVAKNTYVENVESTKQRFEALTRDNEAKLAEFRQGIDGRLTTLSSQIAGKVNEIDFQKVKEASLLYERILGKSEADAPDKLSRLVMSSEIFQTEVGKYAKDDFNLVYDPTNFSKWKKKQPEANVVEVQASTKLLRITNSGHTNNVYRGFALPITTSSFAKDEKLSYRIEAWVDVLPDAPLGIELWNDNSVIASDRVTFSKTGTQIITGTMTVNKTTTKSREFPLEFWLLKNGTVAIGKVSLIRGDRPPKKFTDETSTQDIATQTQVGQLAGSWSVKNLNSNGDILNSINLLANGTNRINGRLTHITGQTLIDNAVIKSAMVDKLKTGNFESGSVTTQILASNAVTADKLLVDSAMINKLVTNQAFIRELVSQKAFITQLNSIDVAAKRFTGDRVQSSDGSLVLDLIKNQLTMTSDTAAIVREQAGFPTQFMRYESSVENGHKHAKTIIGSNRDGSKSWNSPSFAGIVIDNNANSALDNIYQFGDHIHFKHSQGDDGWRFSNVSQIITPGVWNKKSEIWARSFVVPRETRGLTDTPTKFINLVDSVAALWKLWAHAKGQMSMTGAMQTVVQGSLDAWGYSRPHI